MVLEASTLVQRHQMKKIYNRILAKCPRRWQGGNPPSPLCLTVLLLQGHETSIGHGGAQPAIILATKRHPTQIAPTHAHMLTPSTAYHTHPLPRQSPREALPRGLSRGKGKSGGAACKAGLIYLARGIQISLPADRRFQTYTEMAATAAASLRGILDAWPGSIDGVREALLVAFPPGEVDKDGFVLGARERTQLELSFRELVWDEMVCLPRLYLLMLMRARIGDRGYK